MSTYWEHTTGIQPWNACESLLAARRGSLKINLIATPLILSVSITCCVACFALEGDNSFRFHYEDTIKPISFRKQYIKGILKPMK